MVNRHQMVLNDNKQYVSVGFQKSMSYIVVILHMLYQFSTNIYGALKASLPQHVQLLFLDFFLCYCFYFKSYLIITFIQ